MAFEEKPATNGVEVDSSISKIAALTAVGAVSFFSFGFLLNLFFTGGETIYLLSSLISVVAFLVLLLMQVFAVKNFWNAGLAIFIECLALAAGFYDKISLPMVYGGVVFVLMILLIAARNGRKEIGNMLKINFWRISKTVLPKAIAAVALFASLVYVSANDNGFFLSKSNFEKIILPGAAVVKKIYPAVDFTLPINELALKLADEEISKTPGFELLPKSAKAKIISESAQKIENSISDFFGSAANSKFSIIETFYEFAKNKFGELSPNVQSLVLIAAAFAIFLILEGFAFPFRLIVAFIAYIIYEILLATGFMAVVLEGKSREIIVLK